MNSSYITLVILIQVLTVSQATGQIVNGDFESGNAGFTTQYTFAPAGNSATGEYTVGSAPQSWNAAFAAMPDHTTGTGNMLLVNGATLADQALWQQSVNVSPSTPYEFSAWVSTAVAGTPANLTVEVNGIPLLPSFLAPVTTGTWENWTATWNSSSSSTADIRIFNTELAGFANDFYVDDISITAIPEPTAGAILIPLLFAACNARRQRTI